ncbi:ATP-dependent DNA helicase RecG [Dermatobacter hominis]|uniref:ATP-dependent DNA helicase RecG n=1 Tax=Dermatobacter hominis TaxID=2884263 RepID=UPI001D12C967|nr:ATP-dependent DNA helicase RecG [Dermatobacter hominis]UDY36898.1 ATP-dependent DNA helicase RecG [Dermatobacter hominis]
MSDRPPITLVDLSAMGVELLSGVGPRKLEGLRTLGIESLLDLLTYYPRRYVDRTREARIQDLAEGEEALVLGRIGSVSSRRIRGGRVIVVAEVRDGSGSLRCTFFNQPWREKQLTGRSSAGVGPGDAGLEVAMFGRIEVFRGQRQMTNPIVDVIGDPKGGRTGRIVPIYPQSEKARLSTWELGEWSAQVLRRSRERGIDDPVPEDVLDRHDLVGRQDAYAGIHAPSSMAEEVVARRRLVFDELFRLQLALVRRKREIEAASLGIRHVVDDGDDRAAAPGLVARYLGGLPYDLTGAQARAIAEIRHDLAGPVPMHRLLQGDVGSGKTVVAMAALLTAVQGGHQGALMAPTEVLAEQHAVGVRDQLQDVTLTDGGDTLLGERPLGIALLTNRTPAAERRRTLAGLADGTVDIVIGTHALIQDAVEFRSLGVVVIDEQHRFGVEQRAALRDANADGTVPDVLVMTATPIPRTAAMTVYGDLDTTVLDELPPGRVPITTSWARTDEAEADAWQLVRDQVAAGGRAYVVCPLIEDSPKLEASSAEETYERLATGELQGLRLGLLHGRMKAPEKAEVMEGFRTGALDVLVATTVIEVGVDVPEATVMVVLDADRFGIAQLHQLRGRVGRSDAPSWCVLVAHGVLTPDGEERLEAMVRSTDGFELAEVDLELRGEGAVLGERQRGRSDLKLASLRHDRQWVEIARDEALALVGDGSGLDDHPRLVEELDVLLAPEEEDFLLKS